MNERKLINNVTCFDEKQFMQFLTNTAEWWNVVSMVNDSWDVIKHFIKV